MHSSRSVTQRRRRSPSEGAFEPTLEPAVRVLYDRHRDRDVCCMVGFMMRVASNSSHGRKHASHIAGTGLGSWYSKHHRRRLSIV